MEAPLLLAFTAGLVATVNPCGIAMLPAYLSYFLGVSGETAEGERGAGVARALVVGAVVSAGFLLVFGVAGALVTLGLREVIDLLPWAALVVGAGIAVLGVAMLAGYQLDVSLPKPGRTAEGRGYPALLLFGTSYAVASLSCTLPVFLAVVAGVIPSLSLLGGITVFLAYGIGMSVVLVAVTLAIAAGQHSLVRRVRSAARYVDRAAGGILLLAGAYIIYFWVSNLRDPLATSDPVLLVERLSAGLTNLIGDAPLLWGSGLGGLVVAAVVYALWTARRAGAETRSREPAGRR